MPSNVFHNYFAKCVKEKLNPEIVSVINRYEKAYLVGSQGPDLLFYLRFEEKPLSELGAMVHRSLKIYDIFNKSADYARNNPDGAILAFLLGQLCHYSLDGNLHSYVFHRELDLPKFYTKGAHKYIHVVFESALDYIIVRDYLKVNTRLYKGYKNINLDKPSIGDVAKYYNELVAPYFNITLPVEKAEKMIRLMRTFMRIADDTTGIRYILIRGLEKLLRQPRNISAFIRPTKEHLDEDWLNHNKTPYPKYRYEDIMSTLTVEEMTKTALSEAVELINNFYECVTEGVKLNEDLYFRNYLGERYIKGNKHGF